MTNRWPRTGAALTLVLVAGLGVAGCGASTGNADGEVEILFTYPNPTSDKSPYEELAKLYEDENPNVTMKLTALPNDTYSETVLTQLRGGNAPDVFATAPGSGELNAILPLADANMLAPLDADAKELIPAGSEDLFVVGDDIYGVPMGMTVNGLVVAGAGLQPLGLEPFPATVDDFIAKCGQLKQMGMSFVVLAGAAPPNTGLAALTVAAGAVYAEDPDWNAQRADGSVSFADSEGWQNTLDIIVALNEGGCFQDGAEGAGFDAIPNTLQQQKAVGAFIPGNSVGELVTAAPQANWLIEPFPTESGEPFGLVSSSYALSVPAEAKHKEAALEFLKWVAEPEQATAFAEMSDSLPTVGFADIDLSETVSAPFADILAAGEFTDLPNATWPNASVYEALSTGVQGLLTGQATPEQVLENMDAAWDK